MGIGEEFRDKGTYGTVIWGRRTRSRNMRMGGYGGGEGNMGRLSEIQHTGEGISDMRRERKRTSVK